MVLPQTADRTAAALFHRSGLSASLIHFYGEGEGEAEGRVTMVTVVTSHNGHKKKNGLRTQTTVGPPGCGGNCFLLEHHERTELYPLLRRKARCTVSLVRYVILI
jgi:hypothetical protein